MNLNVLREGEGPDLVLVHGWGMHSGIWKPVYPALSARFRLHLVDLPGHGYNQARPMPNSIEALAAMLLDAAPSTATWLGWSLGGMAAIAAAVAVPGRVRHLITVGSTPRFVQGKAWQHGVRPSALNAFLEALQRDYRATVQQFMALQVQGDDAARQVLRELRHHLFDHGDPSPQSLATGLVLLRDTDLRDRVRQLSMPVLAISGDRDRLTPSHASDWMVSQCDGGRHEIVRGAAHAPFLSHPAEFMRVLNDFVHDRQDSRQAS